MKTSHLYLLLLSLLFFISFTHSIEDDIRCLQGLKSSLKDPKNRLSSWSFINTTVGFVCKFIGVSCWNERENRLIGLQLESMELGGEIPDSLQYCQILTTLDLSNNSLSGSIPSQLCNWLPYLVNIDLSQNNLTGPIPSELGNCLFLNILLLGDNRLSGSIPSQLSRLTRLRKFSVANNHLSGEIPSFLSNFESSGFEGNSGLCGKPLGSKCGGVKKKNLSFGGAF